MTPSSIVRAQGGDETAFQHVMESYGDLAWRTAWVLTGDHTLAEDAVQEAWLDVWQHFDRYDPARPFRPWLLAIVARRCHGMTRRRRVPTEPLDRLSEAQMPSLDDVAEAYLHLEADGELRQALATLPPDQRQILDLRFFAELELAEIADLLNIPLGTVKSRVHRALQQLRTRLPARSTSHE
jgi:RNA polymerase sigma-70 factor (ECF subfamily)